MITFLLSKLSEILPMGHWNKAPAKVIKTKRIEVSKIDKFITVAYTAVIVNIADIVKPVQNIATLPNGEVLNSIKNIDGFLVGGASQDAKKFIDIMLNETNRMDQLITDLLTLSKIEQEEHKRPGDKINIRDVLNSVSSNLQTLSENKKINILNHVTENCFVIGDYNKLVEIFYNIVQNAIKYSNSNTQINITQFKNTDNVTIKVKDEGYGIPKTSIPRVTERFFRVDTEKSKKVGGTGLGLAIMKHIISQHRGDYEILSKLNEGTEIKIYLPTK